MPKEQNNPKPQHQPKPQERPQPKPSQPSREKSVPLQAPSPGIERGTGRPPAKK